VENASPAILWPALDDADPFLAPRSRAPFVWEHPVCPGPLCGCPVDLEELSPVAP